MSMGKRIREKRTAIGLTQKQVADYFGIKPPSVSEWESGGSKPDSAKLASLAQLLKTSVRYLLTGSDTHEYSQLDRRARDYKRAEESEFLSDANIEEARIKGKLPLISEVQAGQWSEIVDNFHPNDAEDWIPCPFSHGPNAFILRVSGYSMYNPGGEKSYAPGEFIAVDPSGEPLNKRMVVARVDHEEKATFKQLLVDSEGTMMLQALNPSHSPRIMPLPEGSSIVGVVIGKWTPE